MHLCVSMSLVSMSEKETIVRESKPSLSVSVDTARQEFEAWADQEWVIFYRGNQRLRSFMVIGSKRTIAERLEILKADLRLGVYSRFGFNTSNTSAHVVGA